MDAQAADLGKEDGYSLQHDNGEHGCLCSRQCCCPSCCLQSPHRFRDARHKGSTYQVIWDSGASILISPDRQDFGPLVRPSVRQRLQGIAKGLNVEGHGHVLWACHDTSGQLRLLKVPAYCVPKCRVRLLSTTSLLQTYADEKIAVQAHCLTCSGC